MRQLLFLKVQYTESGERFWVDVALHDVETGRVYGLVANKLQETPLDTWHPICFHVFHVWEAQSFEDVGKAEEGEQTWEWVPSSHPPHEDFIGDDKVALVLGDNIFYGHSLVELLNSANNRKEGATIFAYRVHDPERYGVVEFDQRGRVISLKEKPEDTRSNYAVTGLYFYDNNAVQFSKQIKPSLRGELEITDLNRMYLEKGTLSVEVMGRGYAWLDTGTHESLLKANQFVQTIEDRQGLKVACPEEIAFCRKWISEEQLEKLAESMINNSYGQYLIQVLEEGRSS